MDSESIEVPSCNICDRTDELVFCEGCEAYYCDACWERLKSHKRQGLGAGGVPHGKSRPEIVHVIKESMAEPKNDGEEVEQHVRDADSIWFGLSQDDGGEPALADYRRYASVILESNPEATGPRYPGLVSFIGPTSMYIVYTCLTRMMDSHSMTDHLRLRQEHSHQAPHRSDPACSRSEHCCTCHWAERLRNTYIRRCSSIH